MGKDKNSTLTKTKKKSLIADIKVINYISDMSNGIFKNMKNKTLKTTCEKEKRQAICIYAG